MIIAKTRIKEMPKTCKQCDYRALYPVEGEEICGIYGSFCPWEMKPNGMYGLGKPDWCPLMEVAPTIDAVVNDDPYIADWRFDEMIENLPASDVAPVRHGRWIEYTKVIIPEPYNKWEQAWKCSECGFDDGFVAYNFCPNCGARMDGECDAE